MLVPESLWTPSLRDSLSPGLEIFLRDLTATNNATTVQAQLQVPTDRILIVTSAVSRARFTAGVGNALNRHLIQVSGPAPLDLVTITDPGSLNVAVNVFNALGLKSEIWVPAGGVVSATATFAVADASNEVDIEVCGLLMPRGNVLNAGG